MGGRRGSVRWEGGGEGKKISGGEGGREGGGMERERKRERERGRGIVGGEMREGGMFSEKQL